MILRVLPSAFPKTWILQVILYYGVMKGKKAYKKRV